MRGRALSLLVPMSPSLVLGIVVVVMLIAARTLLVYSERRVAPEIWLGVYLPEVLVVWTVWGVALGAATAMLGVAASDFFRLWPALRFVRAVFSGAVAFVICWSVALLLGFVAALARSPGDRGR